MKVIIVKNKKKGLNLRVHKRMQKFWQQVLNLSSNFRELQ